MDLDLLQQMMEFQPLDMVTRTDAERAEYWARQQLCELETYPVPAGHWENLSMAGNPVQRANEALRDTDRINWLGSHLPLFLEKVGTLPQPLKYFSGIQLRDLLDRAIIEDMQRFLDRALILEQARKDQKRAEWDPLAPVQVSAP